MRGSWFVVHGPESVVHGPEFAVRGARCVDGRGAYALGGNVGGKRVVRDKLGRYAAERTTFVCDVGETL